MSNGNITKIAGTISQTAGSLYKVLSKTLILDAPRGRISLISSSTIVYRLGSPQGIIIPHVIVHCRPMENWRGEDFGFDWFRLGDTSIDPFPFDEIVGKSFEKGALITSHGNIGDDFRLSKSEHTLSGQLLRLRRDYDFHYIKGRPYDQTYCVSWLSLFAGATARLNIHIQVEVPPERIEFESNDNFLIIPNVFNAVSDSVQQLSIRCLRQFSSDQDLNIFSIYKVPDGELKTLSGKLKVSSNSEIIRQNILLVETIFSEEQTQVQWEPEKEMMRKVLRQAMIEPDFAETTLDFRRLDVDFALFRALFFSNRDQNGSPGKFLYSYRRVVSSEWELADTRNPDISSLPAATQQDLISVSVHQHDLNPPIGPGLHLVTQHLEQLIGKRIAEAQWSRRKYADHIRLFFIPFKNFGPPGSMVFGFQDVATNNVIIFDPHLEDTSVHEVLHAMGLAHTFANAEFCQEAKFTYRPQSTNNVMDYGRQPKYLLYHWQWEELKRYYNDKMDVIGSPSVMSPGSTVAGDPDVDMMLL